MKKRDVIRKIENLIMRMIAEMQKYNCITVDTEIAEGGELCYHIQKGEKFQEEAFEIFDTYVSKATKQRTEFKIEDFHHINYILDDIVINFWDCN